MSNFVDPKAILPVIPARTTRANTSLAPNQQATTSSTNATFSEALPREFKDRIGNTNRDQSRGKAAFERENDQVLEADQEKPKKLNRRSTDKANVNAGPTYSAPINTTSSAVLEAQQFTAEGDLGFDRPLNRFDFAETNSAYVNAGAQKGGFAAATEAALAREQAGRQIKIVPPILTDVNVVV